MQRIKIIRGSVLAGIIILIIVFGIWHTSLHFGFSDFVLLITVLVIAWYSGETLALVELTRLKDQPFLELSFKEDGADVFLENLGASPAYDPKISSLRLGRDTFDFDPLYLSKAPIAVKESRKVWMYHNHMEDGTSKSFVYSYPALRDALEASGNSKLLITYFDKEGSKCVRNIYLKLGGNKMTKRYIYISTSKL